MNRFLLYWTALCVVIFSFSLRIFLQLPDGRLHLIFFDIGQGDSTFVQTPRGQFILIDAGPGTKILDVIGKKMGLFHRTLDLLVVTHFDRDHAEGFLEILKRYEIGAVLVHNFRKNSELENAFFVLAAEKKIPVFLARSDQDFDLGDGIFLDVLWPFSPSAAPVNFSTNGNEYSIVTKIIFRGDGGRGGDGNNENHANNINNPVTKNFLLGTADIGFFTENFLLENDVDLSASVLKVGHHGSKGSSGGTFLNAVNADLAVISSGRKNRYGHPHPDTLQRLRESGAEIRRTDLEGTIEVIF